ncbi:cytochrome b N-terminal domain-containing protein [Halodesulfurarchaeum sp. HSR-GB]|uniref:cytochrome b n=1 Tax=Halodesulfurarchaeum sp. HSR-GB TaxID=3074077 RepID=UPI00285C583D|nr:cytochrome b N-terminal domain-containing protein [Halodesulfurarchaeum sp. HSR-GB]MDR5656431.1 cytochrome b N-terminal domain-containing protein [Halodesulfurarchaeum sp. HSR-GB]
MSVGALSWLSDRLHLDENQGLLGKAFPAEDSFLLGEVALFSFVIIVLSGIFLGAFYEPSTVDVAYNGVVDQFQGEELPAAFVSVLHITYGVPFGMFIRRLHHWAAHLFVASIALHMFRVYFNGAYRNPREINWVIGSLLAVLAMAASYTGYALPFDEFASTATGIGYNIAASVPIFGDFLAQLVFAGEFPSAGAIPRLYFLHVLLIPALIVGLLVVHMLVLVKQKHTEGERSSSEAAAADVDQDDESVVLGLPAYPNQAAVGAVVFFLTAGVLSLLAGFLPVHNIVAYGPNDPASTPGLVMPDWFLMWLYGFLKVLPGWMAFSVAGVEFSAEFLGALVLPTLVIGVVVLWPFIESDPGPKHFTADPLAAPKRTAIGIAGIALVLVASLAGMNNLFGGALGISTDVLNPILAVAILVVPIAAGVVTYVIVDTGTGGNG